MDVIYFIFSCHKNKTRDFFLSTHLSICLNRGHKIAAVTRCVLPCPRTSIVRGNRIRATSVKRRNKVVKEIERNVANVFSFYAIIAIEHGLSMHKQSPGPVRGVENRGRDVC